MSYIKTYKILGMLKSGNATNFLLNILTEIRAVEDS